MRDRRIAMAAATAALFLAGCGGSQDVPAQVTAESTPPADVTTAPPTRTIDPDAPDAAVFKDSDQMSHTMCDLWTSALDDPSDLRDVADDVTWYAQQSKNEFMQGAGALYDWGPGDPSYTDVLCKWNGYEVEDGSPADLLS